ncbi:hypothetical protein V6N13_014393 [Hibiscus sabdariffa]|uniref:TRF2/HOY1 PH-like domain-containing protein n=1 Tax=Hibiscus sabdariffa TaxID=183260 RepID=A0ABR2RVP0_9ROSI
MEQGNLVPDERIRESATLMNSNNTPPSFDESWVQSPQVNFVEAMNKLPDLGLKLSPTQSFLEKLDQLFLKKGYSLNGEQQTSSSNHASAMAKGKSKVDILQHANKLKAEKFLISFIRIGQWQRVSRKDHDMEAKCYFAKKKLVWEFLEDRLKRKIEIQWSDILSLRADLQQGQPGILELELSQVPIFFHERDPQPRKHTQWKPDVDFTGNQASNYRRHYLEFPPGALNKHIDKLLSYDRRLGMLSRQGFPTLNSPFFPNMESEQSSLDFGGQLHIAPQHQQVSFENVPTHYQTFQPEPLNSLAPGTWTAETMIDSQGRVINVGDNLNPNQITAMMPVMPLNAATNISYQNNDLPPLPPSEFEKVVHSQQPPMFRTLNEQHQNMPLNNLQARFSNDIMDIDLLLQEQLQNNTNNVVSPNMVANNMLMNNVFLPNNVSVGEQTKDTDFSLWGQLPNNTNNVRTPNMVDNSASINNASPNNVSDGEQTKNTDFLLRGQLPNNTNNVGSPNMVDNGVLINNALPNNVSDGEQTNPILPVMDGKSESSSSSSSLNFDDRFNQEINIWNSDFSCQPWQ